MVNYHDLLVLLCKDILQTVDIGEIRRMTKDCLAKLPPDEDTEYTDEMRDGH